MKRLLTALLLTLGPMLAEGQWKISGIIRDRTSQAVVAYCNIGIPEKGIGTVCNEQGRFELMIPQEFAGEELLISHLGYEDHKVQISELAKTAGDVKIELQATEIKLPEVAVHAQQQVTIGYKPTADAAKGFFRAEGLGMEGGTLIKNEDTIALSVFHMNILKVPFDSLKFRLNMYAANKQRVAEKLNSRDLLFTITKGDTGIYSLPLEGVPIPGDFICSIELVELYGQPPEGAEFLFSALQGKEGIIYKRGISMGKWERLKKVSLCFWFDGRR